MKIQIIIDENTITEEENNKIKSSFKNCDFIDSKIDDFFTFGFENVQGTRFDTIYVSRSSRNYFIVDSDGKQWYPTLIQIDHNLKWWQKNNEGSVDAKAKTVDDFIQGNIYTLFSEKYAFTNDFTLSKKNTTAIYSRISLGDEFDEETEDVISVYSLGRFYGRHKRADNMDFLSSKIEMKYSKTQHQLDVLSNFIKNSLEYFLERSSTTYDYFCYIPAKKDQFDRFKKAIPNNILKLNREVDSLKQKNQVEREKEMEGSISVVEGIDVRGKKILFVDDVITTGTSLNEVVKVLYANGAEKVTVLSLAQTYQSYLEANEIPCPKCKSLVQIRYRNANGDPFLVCKNPECNEKFGAKIYLFKIYYFIYGMIHLNDWKD
ncbi:MAG: hypothetical protein K2M08_00030 [Anaeroplasmataceae bacterium]|nr:hypothetical protein [Anaeroplasmataceae bacterium]